MHYQFNRPFHADSIEGAETQYSIVPPGLYTCEINDSRQVEARSGAKMLVVTFRIVGGEQDQCLFPVRLNLWHPNEQPREIAQQELARIVKAAGKGDEEISSLEPLEGIRMQVRATQRIDGDNTYNDFREWAPAPRSVADQRSEKRSEAAPSNVKEQIKKDEDLGDDYIPF